MSGSPFREATLPAESEGGVAGAHPAEPSRWTRIELWLERAGERLNPILVKEARQALKSNQFLITFTLLLACGWGWSLIGVMLGMPDIRYTPSGTHMLMGYFCVLVVPLFIIVPFAAFRSLAAEREDGTFELMSITTLSARQIVTGKLGSAVLQMLVYYSALSPCIAFTYLLRGIDVAVIAVVLFYTLAISILLAIFGLLVATLSRHRHWQVVLSIGLILALVLATWGWSLFVIMELLELGMAIPLEEPLFWASQLTILTVMVSFGLLFVQAAASRITFASDNRATNLRVTIFIQFVLYVAWTCYYLTYEFDSEIIFILMMFPAMYAAVVGAMMIGESPVLSPRVRRQLPQSFLGRAAFTWFNPGSATGYFFVVSCLLGVLLMTGGLEFYGAVSGKMRSFFSSDHRYLWFGVLAWCYVTGYLGATRLLVLVARRFHVASPALSLLLTLMLASAGVAAPLILEGLAVGFHQLDYSVVQITNWPWTLSYCLMKGMSAHVEVLLIAPCVAFVFLIINVFLAGREVGQVREETVLPPPS